MTQLPLSITDRSVMVDYIQVLQLPDGNTLKLLLCLCIPTFMRRRANDPESAGRAGKVKME